jgi:outer membrane protein OmpA-like peptidoglycan-associated protein
LAKERRLAEETEQQAEQEKLRRAQAEAERAQALLEQEKAQLRAKLLKQFSMVLETRDTGRGLVVNMSDVLFDTGKYTLRRVARGKLARIAGILLNYPGLRLQTEDHTDSTGSYELNQRLSEQRAEEVREYLISQGIPADSITSVGMGYSTPIASNDTYEGRQKNRRVELIVSGEVIDISIGDL